MPRPIPWQNLALRARLLAQLRGFFAVHGFLEVETPLLSHDIVVDRHLDPFRTTLAPDARSPERGRTMWLQTSPEFGMKRLLAAAAAEEGAGSRAPEVGRRIYQVTRSFRNGEQGPRHNPEFTIVEWYSRDHDYRGMLAFTSELCEALLGTPPAECLTYTAAFQQAAGLDPHAATAAELAEAARRCGVAAPASLTVEDRDGWLDLLAGELVLPHLGRGRPTLLCDYPASQAALAVVRRGPPDVAERFELFVDGIELANGYHELLDPAELRRRNRLANAARQADGKPPLPEESQLLTAMERGLPPCCGVALGFDRLVMAAAGATALDQVMAWPIDEA